MRCSAIVTAVVLLLLVTDGRGEAVKIQERKIDHPVEENGPKIEPRSLDAAATKNVIEVPASPSGKDAKQDPRTTAQLVEEALKLDIPPEIKIPYLPIINFMGMSLSLTNVRIQGLDNYMITPTIILGKEKAGQFSVPKLTMLADPYIAGGQLLNLPFVGEGAFNATILDLTIEVHYRKLDGTVFCVTPNSTRFDITLDRLVVKFEDLNPGTNTGELINTMISAYGPDMMALLTLACNDENLLHPLADKIIVNVIGKSCTRMPDVADPDAENGKTGEVCSPKSSNSCGEENIEVAEENSSTFIRGGDSTKLRVSENIVQHFNEWTRLLASTLAEPIAEILQQVNLDLDLQQSD